ncbi:MAG: phenylalanine--tRNA ligase subunit beta, partial [Chloroflexi bacterium]|nr:phenylalanine--tRNA ligase subunit beta [Chloroflexota bacterium]
FKLAGIRPINCIVDATNYAMLELGEPLHAFDYDVLKGRTGGNKVKIITRSAKEGEKLTTLDGVDRRLTSMNVLVCDEKGPLSLAGVMGGVESEVHDASKEVLDAQGIDRSKLESGNLHEGKISLRGRSTTDILLEGAAWNFINIRRTAKQHNLPSEASFRFSRGVHPSLAEIGVKRGLQYMAMWSGGKVAPGLVDAYPLKPKDPAITVTQYDVRRLLGIDLSAKEIAALLTRLEFKCTVEKDKVRAKTPPHRMDIGEGVVGLADLLEEVARSYGYDRIPTTTMADALPAQAGNPIYEWEEHLRDRLVALGLQEIVSYRMTSTERESRLTAHESYVRIANPITPERSVLRRSLLASVLETVERNARTSSQAMFEIGPVFEPQGEKLPREPRRLAIVMTGRRLAPSWDVQESPEFDFYDMKGRLELFLAGLHLSDFEFIESEAVHLHPGKSAVLRVNGQVLGNFGELHPLVKEKYDLGDAPVIVGEFDLDLMRSLNPTYGVRSIPDTPPIYEDIALIVDESIPAARVESLIRQTGGKILAEVRLFDVYRGDQIGTGKKSLAYSLTYQSEATMTDSEAAAVRNQIVKRLENEIGAKLRG